MEPVYTIENDGLSDTIRIRKNGKFITRSEVHYIDFNEMSSNILLRNSNLNKSGYWYFQTTMSCEDAWNALRYGYIGIRVYKTTLSGFNFVRANYIFNTMFSEKVTLQSSKILKECCLKQYPYSSYSITMATKDPNDPLVTEKFYNLLLGAYKDWQYKK